MVPPAPGLRARKKAETRRQLRECALELFGAQGFDETTVAEIAAAANVSEPTFFRYFPSKVAVGVSPLSDAISTLLDLVAARPVDEPPLEACISVAELSTTPGLVLPPATARNFRRLRESPTALAGMLTVFDDAADRLAVDFARRLDTGPDDPLAQQTAGVVAGTLLAALRSWIEDPEGVDPVGIAATGFRRLQHGLR